MIIYDLRVIRMVSKRIKDPTCLTMTKKNDKIVFQTQKQNHIQIRVLSILLVVQWALLVSVFMFFFIIFPLGHAAMMPC